MTHKEWVNGAWYNTPNGIIFLLVSLWHLVLGTMTADAARLSRTGSPLVSRMPIAAAHRKLLATGWHSVVTHLKFTDGVEDSSVGEARVLKDAGITSVEDCSGTGLSFCTFNYRRKTDCLRITSQGEVAPIVVQWDVFRCIDIGYPEHDPMRQPVYIFRHIIDPILACPWDRLDKTPWCYSLTNGLTASIDDGANDGKGREVTLLFPLNRAAIAPQLARALLPSWNDGQGWMERGLRPADYLRPNT